MLKTKHVQYVKYLVWILILIQKKRYRVKDLLKKNCLTSENRDLPDSSKRERTNEISKTYLKDVLVSKQLINENGKNTRTY